MSTDRPLRGMLSLDEVEGFVEQREIDTVLVVFADLNGRWLGKRVTGHFFVDEVAHHGIEACDYLIATDVEMNIVPGYRFANWDMGYGDMVVKPDFATMRRIPWLEKTALVIGDLVDHHGGPIEVSPRQILKTQLARAAKLGLTVKAGAEIEFFLFDESYEQARALGYRDLHPTSTGVQDYHILQTTKDEHLIRAIRNGLDDAGVPIECSKGEAGFGQHEVNLRYAEALESADRLALYKNGAKEIAALAGRSISFMAKWTMDDVGSSFHVHSSLWSTDDQPVDAGDGRHGLSELFASYVAGMVETAREFAFLFAPTINSYKRFQPGSWAPTAVAWGTDNRTCGLRLVGHGPSVRVETRIPGADANPYLCLAGVIAGGLHGIDNSMTLPEPFIGNAYHATDVPRIPRTLVEAIELLESSTAAKAAFGDDVHHHLLNTAKQEWAAFNRTVTDWERMRYFERG